MARAEADRERQFAAFVAEHRDRAVGLAARLLGGELGAAEDVAQEAFVKAYRALDRFRQEARLSTWFYRILINEVNRHRRWRAVRRRFAGPWPADVPDPAAGVLPDPGLQRRVASALERLPRGQREAFVMVHLEGFTVAQTAEATGRAVGTVKAHLHRALRALRRDLADLHPQGRLAT
jgi:RNA polymerase sigma-70 factor (ECF subfamily)